MVSRTAPERPADLLTLTEAARLTGQPKAYLRELIDAGRLAVHLMAEDGAQRPRLSRQTLATAGLLPTSGAAEQANELTRQLRKQADRLERLERRLSDARERLATAEARLTELEGRPSTVPASNYRAAGGNGAVDRRLPVSRKPLPVSRRPFR
jgi:hypothetical protein